MQAGQACVARWLAPGMLREAAGGGACCHVKGTDAARLWASAVLCVDSWRRRSGARRFRKITQ